MSFSQVELVNALRLLSGRLHGAKQTINCCWPIWWCKVAGLLISGVKNREQLTSILGQRQAVLYEAHQARIALAHAVAAQYFAW
ncbi:MULTISPECIES: hypothetical protein [Neisseria]|uniref:hypothetical protein n=1 Tax=Neisseria TaxID=482 RepID=UPI001E590FC3|nr:MULTISPECIES: hypothetical protein [Neisseria]